jgi:hypothetical protein
MSTGARFRRAGSDGQWQQGAASRGLPALLPRSGNLIMALAHQPNRDSPLSVKRIFKTATVVTRQVGARLPLLRVETAYG